MNVEFKQDDYINLAKEVCLLDRELNMYLDIIANRYLINNTIDQANATYEAKTILDRMSNCIVQMNFIAVNSNKEEENGVSENRQNDNTNNDNDSSNIRDNLELCDSEEGNKQLLEDSKSGDVEEGDK